MIVTNLWCIVNNEALSAETTNELIQVLKDGGCDVGVCHDGTNRVFTSVPTISPELEQFTVRVELTEDATEQALIMQVGAFLKAAYLDKVLVADSSVFTALFNHPVHKLWCGSYEDKDSLESDYIKVFTTDKLDKRKSLDNLKIQVREDIFRMLP